MSRICSQPVIHVHDEDEMLPEITERDTQSIMYDIKTIDGLVDALGGDTVLARDLGISQPAVANWKVRGQIGAGWHMRLYAKIRARGLTIDPNIFGLTEDEAIGLGPLERGVRREVVAA